MSAPIAEADAPAAIAPAPYDIAPSPPPRPRDRRHFSSFLFHFSFSAKTPPCPKPARFTTLLRVAAWSYFLAVLSIWLLLRLAAERWWPATLLLFAPRWNLALPLTILLPAALAARAMRRTLPPLAAAAAIVLFPIMDLRIPWCTLRARAAAAIQPASPPPAPRGTIRLLTCNIHGVELDAPALGRCLAESQPDVVALQGWLRHHRQAVFPAAAGWQVAEDGQLCVASRRFAVTRLATIVLPSRTENGMTSAFAIHAEAVGIPGFRLIDVHVDSPHRAFAAALCAAPGAADLIDANTARRWQQAQAIARYADSLSSNTTILAGDFNMPDDSPVYQAAFPPSGAASGPWTDAFSTAGWGTGNTYFGGGTAARIDHLLSDPRAWRCTRCTIGPAVGSPHRPLVAELQWIGPAGDLHPRADPPIVVDVSH